MNMIKKILTICVFITSISMLISCGGDGIGGTGIQPSSSNDESVETISRLSLTFREHGYSNFDTTTITSQVELEQFISNVNAQNGWNDKAGFLQSIQSANVDFTLQNLLLFRITEVSGSIILTPHVPVLIDGDIHITIDRNVPQVGDTAIANYVLGYSVDKSVSKVVFEIDSVETIINPTISTVSTAQGKLIRSNEADLLAYFQSSVRRSTIYSVSSDVAQEAAPIFSASASNEAVSSTNLQERGVDEADLIKTDGRYIFSVKKFSSSQLLVATNSSPIAPASIASDAIRIMDTETTNGLTEIKHLSGNENPWRIAGLYLHETQERLIALSSENKSYWQNWFHSQYFSNQETNVLFIDVNEASDATVESTINFEGQLVTSRRNGDTLYLVLRHYPNYHYVDNSTLQTATVNDFLPTYQLGNENREAIVKPQDCFLEEGQEGSRDIITLVAIDLKSATPEINSQCFVGSSEAVYASQNALYLATTKWGYQVSNGFAEYNDIITTDIHKFSYNGLVFEYRGSGEVEGHLGHKQDSKSFRFSEHQGKLRVVTFDEDQWVTLLSTEISEPQPVADDDVITTTVQTTQSLAAIKSPVSLTILQEDVSNKALKVVSKLPNLHHPEPIGLPGERLYATRFMGNRAYVVTFRVTDPLYVLDLSDPADPVIAGELKVDGYSDYLHPINDRLLLGIGKDAVPDGNGDDSRGAWYQGVKLSLLDVSDPANPQEVDKVVLGKRGTESTVLNDHHGFTSLQVGNTFRVAIPVRLHEGLANTPTAPEPFTFYDYKQTGLYRFDIDIDNQKINPVAPIIAQEPEGQIDRYIGNDRSVMMNDNVYYMHNGNFWVQDWQGGTAVQDSL